MKRFLFLPIMAVMFCINTNLFAQNKEEGDDYMEEINYPVKFSGAQPNIVDFVNAFLNIEGVCEGFQAIREAMEQYNKGQKVARGVLTVDKKNGYLSHTVDWGAEDEEDPTPHVSTVEACYWNCKDGKHKLFAVNLNSKYGNSYICTEVTGVSFQLYNNQTRTMVWKSPCDFGIDVEYGEDSWPVFFLPQTGKDIKVEMMNNEAPTAPRRTFTFSWNGQGF